MQNCIFWYFWYCIFIFVRSNYNWLAISTCCDKSGGLSHDKLRTVSSAHIGILHRTSSGSQLQMKEKEMDQDRILTHSRVNGTLRTWLVFLGNS